MRIASRKPYLAIILILAVSLLLAGLAACAGEPEPTWPATAAPATLAPATSAPPATPIPTPTPTPQPTATPTPTPMPTATATPQPSPDRPALVALYNATDGPNWRDNTNWLSDRPIGEWHGVRTIDGGRVVWLDLTGNQLSGEIPPELGNLVNLSGLILHSNRLSGEIPVELGNLYNLRILNLGNYWELVTESDLFGNRLSEEIPRELDVKQLSGGIPAELGNLTNLTELYLGNNQLSGEIPPELGSLSNLQDLDLGENQLSGEIPVELGNLANLNSLYLYGNQLSGEIPVELGNLANLNSLHLYDNQLSGEIPAGLGNLTNIYELSLFGNQLNGCVPVVLEEQLQYYEGGPSFCGATPTPTPTPAGEPTAPLAERVAAYAQECQAAEVSVSDVLSANLNAEAEDITWGEFTETMDTLVDAYTQLVPPQELRAYHDANLQVGEAIRNHARTRPSGDSFVAEFTLVFVEILGVGFEIAFDGTKTEAEKERLFEEFAVEKLGELFGPDFITATLALEEAEAGLPDETLALLEGSGCELLGDVFGEGQDTTEPEESAADDRAALVALYNATDGPNWTYNTNWLSDRPLGEWYGVETDGKGRVTGLNLGGNELSGEIPVELGNLSSLTWLDLIGNELSGEIPPELGNLANLGGFDLGGNELSGEIPPELGNLASLTSLNLINNELSGEIPPELGNLANLEWLGLGVNQLSGQIPTELGNLVNLRNLWISDNQLSGCIPAELGDVPNSDLNRLRLPDC